MRELLVEKYKILFLSSRAVCENASEKREINIKAKANFLTHIFEKYYITKRAIMQFYFLIFKFRLGKKFHLLACGGMRKTQVRGM